MSGADKDHKETKDNLKMRPIVNAMDGPKKTISDIQYILQMPFNS